MAPGPPFQTGKPRWAKGPCGHKLGDTAPLFWECPNHAVGYIYTYVYIYIHIPNLLQLNQYSTIRNLGVPKNNHLNPAESVGNKAWTCMNNTNRESYCNKCHGNNGSMFFNVFYVNTYPYIPHVDGTRCEPASKLFDHLDHQTGQWIFIPPEQFQKLSHWDLRMELIAHRMVTEASKVPDWAEA